MLDLQPPRHLPRPLACRQEQGDASRLEGPDRDAGLWEPRTLAPAAAAAALAARGDPAVWGEVLAAKAALPLHLRALTLPGESALRGRGSQHPPTR
eukprot:1156636-Pelagomonas_calceolata.AAC.13